VVAVDTSNSTGVYGLESAAAAVAAVTGSPRPDDRFALVAFGTEPRLLSDFRRPGEGEDARALLARQPIAGRTRPAAALRGATEVAERGRLGAGIILVTDGGDRAGVDEAADAARAAAEQGHRTGVCGLGTEIDTAVLDRIGQRGLGESAYGSRRLADDISRMVDTTRSVPLSDVEVEMDGAMDLCPEHVHVVAGDAILVAGRYARTGPTKIRVTGTVAGERVAITIPVDLRETGGDPSVARLWAARRIGLLLDKAREANDPNLHREEIVRLGTRFGIVTPHTSLLVLEEGDQQRMLGGMRRRPLLQSAGGEMVARKAHTSARAETDVALRIRSLKDAQSGEANPFEDLLGANRLRVRHVQDRTFYRLDDGTWVEDALVDREPADPRIVTFLSEDWMALASDPSAAAALSVGRSVLFRLADGSAVRVVEQ